MGRIDEPYVREVADRVYAYIQPDGSWMLDNSGFVVGGDDVVLVDQCGTIDRARALLAAVDVTTSRPIRALINTHHHGDHTFGNCTMPVGTPIIGHRRCRTEVLEAGTEITGLFEGPEFGDIEVRPPTVTFESEMTVWVGEDQLRLLHFGEPAHTTNDVVVWLPERRVLFSGDLVFNGGTPLAFQGSVEGWMRTLDHVDALEPEVIVPGHGPVCGPAAIEDVRRYLSWLDSYGRAARANGLSPLDAARSADLGEFGDLTDQERLVANLHRLFAELDGAALGAPLDLGPIVADMVAFNGGPIRSHA